MEQVVRILKCDVPAPVFAGRPMQGFRHTDNSLYSRTFTPGQTEDEPLSIEPSQHGSDPSSQATSPGASSFPDRPSQRSSVPEALLRNAAKLDCATADAGDAPGDSSVQDVLQRNAARLDCAATAAPQTMHNLESSSLQQHSEQLSDAASGALHPAVSHRSPVSEGHLSKAGQRTNTIPHSSEPASDQRMLVTAAVPWTAEQGQVIAKTGTGNSQQAAQHTTDSLTAGSRTSADFTRVSAGTDGHLNVVEKVYFATPDALAGVAISEHAHAATSEAAQARAAAALSPAAASTAADALLEASLTELAHEPAVPESTAQISPNEFPPQHSRLDTTQSYEAHAVISALNSVSSPQRSLLGPDQTQVAPARSSQRIAEASHHVTGIHGDPLHALDAPQQHQTTAQFKQPSRHAVLNTQQSPANSRKAYKPDQASPALFSPVPNTASRLQSVDAKAKQDNTPGHRLHSPYAASQRGPSPGDRDAAFRKAAELQRQLNLTSTKLQVQARISSDNLTGCASQTYL